MECYFSVAKNYFLKTQTHCTFPRSVYPCKCVIVLVVEAHAVFVKSNNKILVMVYSTTR